MARNSWSALSGEAKDKYRKVIESGSATAYPNLVNPVKIEGEVTTIFCYSKGQLYESYIDTEDLPKLAIGVAISIVNKGSKNGADALYCRLGCPAKHKDGVRGETIHRIVMGRPAGMVVDHINHNSLDNRKCNLRIISHEENTIYKKGFVTNTTGTKNISMKDGYYCLSISRTFLNRQYAEEARKKIYSIMQHYSRLDAKEKAEKRLSGA